MTKIIQNTDAWFKKAIPQPNEKNQRTQLGVHFEEVTEMLAVIRSKDMDTQVLIQAAMAHLKSLANHLKKTDGEITLIDRVEMVDALADQIVTAVGVGHTYGMRVPDALDEVNASNYSKFDDNIEPIFDENMKVIKGPYYIKADLTSFV